MTVMVKPTRNDFVAGQEGRRRPGRGDDAVAKLVSE